jgi:hypothetical protein
MIVKIHENEQTPKIMIRTDAITVKDVKPDPIENYTVTYERIVLDDTFELSKLKPDVTLDVWLTHPTLPKPNVASNVETIEIVGEFNLRELSDNVYVYTSNIEPKVDGPEKQYFATVANMAMEANDPRDDMLYNKSHDWTPKLLQHTNFSIVQKEIKVTTSPPYIGGTLTIPINPRECGDLLSYMYFTCNLPPNVNYTNRVGRALFKRVELCLNEFVIQRYDDNWANIHDELFMSAEESLTLDQILNGSRIIIPMKFFFCEKEQYLPLCALYNQMIYIKIYFHEQSWFTDYPFALEMTNPAIIFDQIFLTTEERNYYKTTKLEIIVPSVDYQLPQIFTNGTVSLNMSTNFDVSMIVWFIRNINYELPVSSAYESRYSYGYVSPLVNSYTKFTNWKGDEVNYVQVIDYVDIYINNRNIISGLTGDIYYTYKQPLEHGLSVPDKTLYTYCFSSEPKNPLKRGDFDFRTLASKTTNLKIKFSESLGPQLTQNYNLYLYYYGYKTLSIDKGFGVLRA